MRGSASCKYLVGFGAVGVLIAGFVLFFSSYYAGSYRPSTAGPLGDGYGGLSALFSGLAFAGMIITMMMQSRELELQRDELEETRKVFLLQKDEMAKQSSALTQQVFETTFFALIENLNKGVDESDSSTVVGPAMRSDAEEIRDMFPGDSGLAHTASEIEDRLRYYPKASRLMQYARDIFEFVIHKGGDYNSVFYHKILFSSLNEFQRALFFYLNYEGRHFMGFVFATKLYTAEPSRVLSWHLDQALNAYRAEFEGWNGE